MLNAGKKVAILVGAGALHATDEVIAVADTLGAGVAKALLGKAALPDDLPWVTGSIGLLGTKPSWDLMTDCDTLLMVGSGFPYSEFLPKEGQARGVQIDIDARHAVHPLSDGGQPRRRQRRDAARAAAAAASRRPTAPGANGIEKQRRGAGGRTLESRALHAGQPGQPAARHVGAFATPAGRRDRHQRFRLLRQLVCARPEDPARHDGSLSGGLASMGAAVPYAIAAKFAHPDRPVIALVGDGAMQMNNMAELITVAKYWRDWANPTGSSASSTTRT